ncbi:MAG: hypothetical protein E7390_02500 [Ruminococcaceae bacterium]|nr:hypothetical protein [Oscillospiraceae bacterium]
MRYIEEHEQGFSFREAYLNSLETLLSKKQAEATVMREARGKDILSNPEIYRKEFLKMLGWPLTEPDDGLPTVEKTLIHEEDEGKIYRMLFTLPIGIRFYGIYFEHITSEKLPFSIVQHGGSGTPEVASGFFKSGSGNYNDMVMRIFNHGINVFAPQLLLWSSTGTKPEYNRENIDCKLKQLGSSITAIEVYGIRKAIDYFAAKENIDTDRIGMSGLSYGGFYTLFTAAADTRIRSALSCSQYNDRFTYARPDWTWQNSGKTFLDNEVAQLVYPRYLCLAVGDADRTFEPGNVQMQFDKLSASLPDKSRMDFTVFEGKHEYIKEDFYVDKFVAELKK